MALQEEVGAGQGLGRSLLGQQARIQPDDAVRRRLPLVALVHRKAGGGSADLDGVGTEHDPVVAQPELDAGRVGGLVRVLLGLHVGQEAAEALAGGLEIQGLGRALRRHRVKVVPFPRRHVP